MFKRGKYTTEVLVQAIKDGGDLEDKAITHLIREDFDKVSHLITSRSGSLADAEDIFQEGLTALIINVKKDRFKGQSSIHTYLYAICKGMWYKRFKKYVREKEHASSLMVDDRDDNTPEEDLIDDEQKMLLVQLFEQLKSKCKEVLYLWGQGYAMVEIAEKLEFSGSQVAMNKKNKCLKELRSLMNHDPLVLQIISELRT